MFDRNEYMQKYNKKGYAANRPARMASAIEHKKQKVEKHLEAINRIKETTPCKDCNKNFLSCVMQYDHTRDKHLNVSAMLYSGYSFDAVMKEISKCDLVCSNCHGVRTHRRGHKEHTRV